MLKRLKTGRERAKYLLLLLALMATGYILIHDLLGGTLLSHSAWDSYTLQALAWRDGRLSLAHNYDYLELAVYGGEYYVSFPPFPSVVMLPFTFIFGENTPNNLIVALVAMASAALVYSMSLRARFSPRDSALLALFITWGSNLMWMSTNGGVWFMAQSLNMLLLLASFSFAMSGKRTGAYLMIAFAVGCRPFSAFAFIPLFVYFYMEDKARSPGAGFLTTALRQWKAWLPVALVAAAYMWYNYARFGNVLEFGHNYLPEFTEAEKGQFDISYIWNNLYNILLRPITLGEGLSLEYPVFDGFAFYVANPFFIVSAAALIRRARAGSPDPVTLALAGTELLMLLALAAHKTFGGWQFGARYTVDLLPLALALFLKERTDAAAKQADALPAPKVSLWERALAYFGIALNIYGALAMNLIN